MLEFSYLFDVFVAVVELRNGLLSYELFFYVFLLFGWRVDLWLLQWKVGNHGKGLMVLFDLQLSLIPLHFYNSFLWFGLLSDEIVLCVLAEHINSRLCHSFLLFLQQRLVDFFIRGVHALVDLLRQVEMHRKALVVDVALSCLPEGFLFRAH